MRSLALREHRAYALGEISYPEKRVDGSRVARLRRISPAPQPISHTLAGAIAWRSSIAAMCPAVHGRSECAVARIAEREAHRADGHRGDARWAPGLHVEGRSPGAVERPRIGAVAGLRHVRAHKPHAFAVGAIRKPRHEEDVALM